jgi:hypothetical protein
MDSGKIIYPMDLENRILVEERYMREIFIRERKLEKEYMLGPNLTTIEDMMVIFRTT